MGRPAFRGYDRPAMPLHRHGTVRWRGGGAAPVPLAHGGRLTRQHSHRGPAQRRALSGVVAEYGHAFVQRDPHLRQVFTTWVEHIFCLAGLRRCRPCARRVCLTLSGTTSQSEWVHVCFVSLPNATSK